MILQFPASDADKKRGEGGDEGWRWMRVSREEERKGEERAWEEEEDGEGGRGEGERDEGV